MAQKSFIAACREYFEFLPGQKLGEFAAEVGALTYAEKVEIAEGMRKVTGWDIADPLVKA